MKCCDIIFTRITEQTQVEVESRVSQATFDVSFQAHIRSFLEGTEAYRSEKWSEVIEKMEETVEKYLTAEEECRFGCERPFDMGWFPDFITSISS